MKINDNMLTVCKGLSALDTELSIAKKRVSNPFTTEGVELPEKVKKFNEDTLKRLNSIKAAFDILTA